MLNYVHFGQLHIIKIGDFQVSSTVSVEVVSQSGHNSVSRAAVWPFCLDGFVGWVSTLHTFERRAMDGVPQMKMWAPTLRGPPVKPSVLMRLVYTAAIGAMALL